MEFRIELGYLLVGVLDHFSIARRAGSDEKRSFSLIGAPMVRFPLFISLGLLLATSCPAQQAPVVSAASVPVFAIGLDKLQWSKNPSTGPLEFATIVGDRGKPGLYIQFVRWPPHTVYKAHSHPDDRYAIVLSGTFYHGFGDKLDESKFEERPAGTFFTEPKGVRHFGMTKDEGAVLYFVGTGPSTNDNPEK
jgi:quercetin dioxygenase-like cupin family protein